MEDCHSLPNTELSPKQNAGYHAPDQVVDAAVGSTSGAKYRLMSPAKLPISRSTCITIPPGLSPTAFLDSPVLLSDIKVEPSPTTGSLFKPQVMQGSGQNTVVLLENSCPSSKDVNSESSSSFEFRFHTGASFNSRYESTGLSIPGGMTKRGLSSNQDQSYSHPSSSSSQAAPAGDDAAICRSTVADEFSQEGALSRGIQASASDRKDGISSAGVDRTSDDGYNWRKYGQKLVKGSEFPRSYYKCTFPNCEVKKIFERSPSGHITEIVYKGSHDHPKPQAARRHNSGVALPAHEDKMNKDLLLPGHEDKFNTSNVEQNGSPVVSPLQANDEGLDSAGPQVPVSTEDVEEDDPFTKRRKLEDCMDVTPVVKPIREPRVVVQTVSEVDILDDGYRWRKYGQKVVRGNPNPRSYYKCTNSGCPVRKHVERASHDPKAVITTYEGKHNHDVPTAKGNSHDFPRTAQPPYVGASKVRPQDSAPISLDLGVGINQNRPNEPVRGAMESDSTLSAVHTTQDPGCYGIVANPYGIQENTIDGHGFQTPSVHPSNQYPPLQAIGRILMEPSTNPSI